MVLTKSGLVIRKNSDPSSKIHFILSLHYHVSINPTDTLSIGLNGAILFGYCPRLAIAGSSSSSSSSNSANTIIDEDLIGSEIVEEDAMYHLSHDASHKNGKLRQQQHEATHKEVIRRQVEIGFDSKDIQSEWIDAIMDRFFAIVNPIVN